MRKQPHPHQRLKTADSGSRSCVNRTGVNIWAVRRCTIHARSQQCQRYRPSPGNLRKGALVELLHEVLIYGRSDHETSRNPVSYRLSTAVNLSGDSAHRLAGSSSTSTSAAAGNGQLGTVVFADGDILFVKLTVSKYPSITLVSTSTSKKTTARPCTTPVRAWQCKGSAEPRLPSGPMQRVHA